MAEYFSGSATILAAIIAICIYFRRRSDTKKDAAKALVIEITEAEDYIKNFKKANSKGEKIIPDDAILASNSWEKYKHLFISRLTAGEWSRVTEFYKNCQKLDEAIILNQSFFGKNEQAIRKVLYETFGKFATDEFKRADDGDYAVQMPDGSTRLADDAIAKFRENIGTKIGIFPQLFLDLIREKSAHYYPDKPIQDTATLMGYIDTGIMDSDIGTKLRKIAKLKK